MADISKIKGLESLVAKLRARAAKVSSNPEVAVGYEAQYAIYLHEMPNARVRTLDQGVERPSGLGVYWGPSQYGPKFLEGPARELRHDLKEIINQAAHQGKNLGQCLLLAGLRLQRESQKRVPVEYGNLKASAFTRLEKGEA